MAKNQPYYATLREHHHLILTSSDRQMNGVNLKKEDAMILGVPEGTACYHTIVLNYNQDNQIYEVVETFGIPEIMHFTLEQDE